MPKPAIGIVRVSQSAGRVGASFVSPVDQAERIRGACDRDDLELVPVGGGIREFEPGLIDEVDVSGGAALEDRAGLLAAVRAIEAGTAQVLIVAYFDRLVRSLRVQGEVVSRVEVAGGQVLAVDIGEVSEGTASKWLSGSMLGLVAEYARRSGAERSAEAQADAVARGVAMISSIPPGYDKGADGKLVPNDHADVMAQAFELRAGGSTMSEIRNFLAENGIERSAHGTASLMHNRYYLGEVNFGKLANLTAHPAIVTLDVWDRAQAVSVPRGRRPKSPVLLARLGVLRCATCESRLVVGVSGDAKNGRKPAYRCANPDCPHRPLMLAEKVDAVIVTAVRGAIDGYEGRAAMETDARQLQQEADDAEAAFEAAVRVFTGMGEEGVVQARLEQLRDDRDAKRKRAAEAVGPGDEMVLLGREWEKLTGDERRALIKAIVRRAAVAPGRGDDRVSVELALGQ